MPETITNYVHIGRMCEESKMPAEKTESKSISDFTQYVRETLVATVSKAIAAGVTES